MSSVIYPRSPREQLEGWCHLPRFLDKIRLHQAGKLAPEYQTNFAHAGFDAAWVKAAGLNADEFIAVVRGTLTDGQVADWIRQHVKRSPEQKAEFNRWLLHRGREENEPAVRERLTMRKTEAGLSHRQDIETFVDFIDADEKRI